MASDYRHEKAVELAKSRADELAKRAKAGENFAAAAKALGLDVKTSDAVSQTGSIPDLGSAKQFAAAFTLPVGQTGDPVALGQNWAVYRVAQHDPVNQDDFDKQKAKIEEQVLQQKAANRLRIVPHGPEKPPPARGQLHFNADNLKRLTNPTNL